MKNNQSGRSMVEMLGVLAIIGVLSAGGLAGYSKAMFKHKLNSTMDQLTMLVTNIRTMYGTQESYKGLNNVSAVALGIVPSQMIADQKAAVAAQAAVGVEGDDDYKPAVAAQDASAKLVNPFKGEVVLSTSEAKSGLSIKSAFVVTYEGLPKEACVTIATSDWGTGAGSGFIAATVNDKGGEAVNGATIPDDIGSAYSGDVGGTAVYEGSPMSVGAALTNCSSEANTVKLKFY